MLGTELFENVRTQLRELLCFYFFSYSWGFDNQNKALVVHGADISPLVDRDSDKEVSYQGQ